MCCSGFNLFWYASSATAAVHNDASTKFVAHLEGEIEPDNWTWVKMNMHIFLTKIGDISNNSWTAIVDTLCKKWQYYS